MGREVSGGADDRHAQVGRDAHRDHVPGDLVALAHAGVIALGDDVDEAVVDVDLELELGVFRQKLREPGPQDRAGRMVVRADPYRPRRLSVEFAQRRQFALYPLVIGADAGEQALTGFGRRDSARRARQQPDAQPLLKPPDAVAERRLRDAELGRRAGEAALAGDDDESLKIVEVCPGH